jgi:TfoX/Sxy family transcriptional regulator of competence genes
MAFPQPSDADKAWFEALLPEAPGVMMLPMFGNYAGFVDGNMFLCLFGDQVAVRLDEAGRAELLAAADSQPFEPMPGRPMKEYVVLPEQWRDTPELAEEWVDRSLEYAAAMPTRHHKGKTAK